MKPLMVSTGDVLSADPRDVVGARDRPPRPCGRHWISASSASAIAGVANWHRRLEVLDDLVRSRCHVAAADPVDLFDEPAVPRFTRRELSPYCSSKPSRSLHRDADVQVVRAGREHVAARARRLVRDHRLDRRVEEHRPQPLQQAVERLVLDAPRKRPPRARAACAAGGERRGRAGAARTCAPSGCCRARC